MHVHETFYILIDMLGLCLVYSQNGVLIPSIFFKLHNFYYGTLNRTQSFITPQFLVENWLPSLVYVARTTHELQRRLESTTT